ncbi:MAG: hypothetical protein PUE67_03425 [Oscillospiraceae bacterium]|nr:hypothetical protein [Oscillospiraceae bacterium]
MLINLVFDFYTDVIDVPDEIGSQIEKYQKKCDKWLFNKLNDHEYWEKDEYGNKIGIGICSDAFVCWLNNFVLNDSEQKAFIVKENVQEYDSSFPTLFY